MRAGLVVFALLLGVSVLAQPSVRELPFVHLTPADQVVPLPAASAQKVVQDRLGFIWFAFFSGGIARYDGARYDRYGTGDGLPDATVREIVEDAEGRLWVGTDAGVAVSSRPLTEGRAGERLRFVTSFGSVGLPSSRIQRNCLAAGVGGVWLGTRSEGLLRVEIDDENRLSIRRVALPPGVGGDVTALRALPDGLIVGTSTGEVVRVSAAEQDRLLATLPQPAGAFFPGADGAILAGCLDGSVWRLAGSPRLVSQSLTERVVAIHRDASGDVWAASLGSGLLWLPAGGGETLLTRRNGLLSDTLWCILEDAEGTLWFGQNGGVSRLRSDFRAFSALTDRSVGGVPGALPDAGTFAVLPADPADPDGVTWVGTGAGLAAVPAIGQTRALTVGDGLASGSVYSLARDRAGRVWIGTAAGLSVLAPGRPPAPFGATRASTVEVLGRRASLVSFPELQTVYGTRALNPGGAEVVLVAGSRGVACYLDGRWHVLGQPAGLPASGASGSTLDGEGRLWVSTLDAGILRTRAPLVPALRSLEAGSLDATGLLLEQAWRRPPDEAGGSVYSLEWAAGRVWAGTARGLVGIRPGEPPHEIVVDTTSGLGGDVVRGVVFSRESGSLWVTQNQGIAEVDPGSGRVLRVVSKLDGLIDDEVWANGPLAVGADGAVHVATPRGVSLYRPALDRVNARAPRLLLRHTGLRQDSWGNNDVSIGLAVLAFASPRVKVRTRLLGLEPGWVEASRSGTVRYTNLPAALFARAYTFEAEARNEDGVASEPVRWTFRIMPPWYLRWWALVVSAASFVGLAWGFSQLRGRALAGRAALLEHQVAERTAELKEQAGELETLEGIVRTINREVSLGALHRIILEQGMVLLPQAEKGQVIAFDREGQVFEVVATVGWSPGSFDGFSLSAGEGELRYTQGAETLEAGVFLIRSFEHRAGGERLAHLPYPRSMLAMKIAHGDETMAFVVFDSYSDPEAFGRSDLLKLRRYREHATSALLKARMLRDLEQASREARAANRAKSVFLASMSHELRTPLNSIIGFSDVLLIKAAPHLPDQMRRFLGHIRDSGQHLLGIINDILDLSKVEAGKMSFHPEAIALPPVLGGVVTLMAGVARGRSIGLDVDIAPGLPEIVADVVKLKQIMYNLLSNAVKFSPDGSRVQVRAMPVGAEQSGIGREAVRVCVTDQGIGIDAVNHALIFEEFRQVDASAARPFGGTGLGLALVKRFVEMHEGTIAVDSALGAGSTFVVTLPVSQRAAGVEHEREPADLEEGGSNVVR